MPSEKMESPAGIILWRYVGHFQRAALVVDIGAGELWDLFGDVAVVIGEAGAEVLALVGWDAVGAPIEGIDGEGFAAGWDHERIGHFRPLRC